MGKIESEVRKKWRKRERERGRGVKRFTNCQKESCSLFLEMFINLERKKRNPESWT